jgi:hypothetical protein
MKMNAGNAQEILAQLRALIPGATTVDKVSISREKRDTLDEARAKVAKKLRDNAEYFTGTGEKVDRVYREHPGDRYSVGIKYGNRYLGGAIAGGTFVPNVTREQLPPLLELLAGQVEQNMYDDAISNVMLDNVENRNKAKHKH